MPRCKFPSCVRATQFRLSARLLRAVLMALIGSLLCSTVVAQALATTLDETAGPSVDHTEEIAPVATKVDVKPVAHDEEIRQRLQSVLEATGWFVEPLVRVEQGVVFLNGPVKSDELKKWAGDLARNTQDVVAVANRMEVAEPAVWDFEPAWSGLMALWRDVIGSLPFVAFGLLILMVSVGAGALATRAARAFLHRRLRAKLLRTVIARGIGVLVFLLGTYIVLRVSGLTQLALTVVGGTGLIGLAVGIAFRDITENFLASIFLSMQRPFETGDLVEVASVTGYVQQLNMRTTVVMTLDGNLVQIPNATVYKSTVRNFTANSNRREDFVVGIGYDDAINEAQEVARKVLGEHPAILQDPEPSVLADSLGPATVNLRVYFWLNGREHSWLKVRSSVIRLVKLAFQESGISMPDESREVVFPRGVPIAMVNGDAFNSPISTARKDSASKAKSDARGDVVSTKAEAGLYSEAEVIEKQAKRAQPLVNRENLLRGDRKGPQAKVE